MGFREDLLEMPQRIFPSSTHFGAICEGEKTTREAFELYFTEELWNHLVEKTNDYAKGDPQKKRKPICYLPNEVLKVTKQDIINYWVIFWHQGLVRCSRRQDYWIPVEQNQGLTFNQFIASTMPYSKWKKIDRALQADLEFIEKYVNETSKKHWNLYKKVSIDDDLDLWKGKGGMKSYISRKADKTGQISWKVLIQCRLN